MQDRKVVLYIAESLDGYIATKDDSLEWLLSVEGEGDNGFGEFYDTVDTIIMGRRTYDWIMEQENGRFPYQGKQCFVVSRTHHENDGFVTFVDGNIGSLIHDLQQGKGKKIWIVGGSQIIAECQKEQLIDEYIINIAPTIIGEGIPLFTPGEEQKLICKRVRTFGQFVEISYEK